MNSSFKFATPIITALCIFFAGSAGYIIIEGWTFLDAFYMTAITLSTVGFMEVHETHTLGKIYTIFLIFVGGGYYVYLLGIISQSILGSVKNIV